MSVLVFGSINLDLIARVRALPGPGETVLGQSLVVAPGGKGANQAMAARRAGVGQVRLVGQVGGDAFAGPALKLLAETDIDLSRVARTAGTHTGIAHTGIAHTGIAMIAVAEDGQNQIVGAVGANGLLRAQGVPDAWLGPDTVVVLQLETPVDQSEILAARAAARGCRIVLNTAPALPVPPGLLDLVDVLVANEHEAPAVARAAGLPADTPVMAARGLMRGRKMAVVVTLGAAGAIAFRSGQGWLVPALRLDKVADTVGAGDAFIGALAAALERGSELPAALARASVAGALACTRAGAQPAMPTAGEIDAALPRLAPIGAVQYD